MKKRHLAAMSSLLGLILACGGAGESRPLDEPAPADMLVSAAELGAAFDAAKKAETIADFQATYEGKRLEVTGTAAKDYGMGELQLVGGESSMTGPRISGWRSSSHERIGKKAKKGDAIHVWCEAKTFGMGAKLEECAFSQHTRIDLLP